MKKIVLAIVALGLSISVTAGAQKRRIGMRRAKAIAAENATGRIEGSELEKEHGKWVYSFDVRNAKGTITEVQVDAYTGKVVSVEEENAQQEADEKRQEKREKH